MRLVYKYRALVFRDSRGKLHFALVKSWRHLKSRELIEWLGSDEVLDGKFLSKEEFGELEEMLSVISVFNS